MRHTVLLFLFHLSFLISFGQQEFHVFPEDHTNSPGRSTGDGTLNNPWDLQTALLQPSDTVKPGDTIWLHEGIYNGRFVSKLKSPEPNTFITVSAFKDDKVILNGNVSSKRNMVLEIRGEQVIYKDFEVTYMGDFSRDENDPSFEQCGGVRHLSGENCRFYNLRIHNTPGLGFGFWKHGAGSIIENCMIFNNGFVAKGGKGRGEGIYVQNQSDEMRIIRNNIIFNNYYKGIEVWSAGKRATFEYVKNIELEGNIIFNSGSPSGILRDNVIVASHDRNSLNLAKNIILRDNVFYHNTSKPDGTIYGEGPSLTLGFIKKAPIVDVKVDGNIIIGGYNGLRILQTKSLEFTNNIVHTGIIQVGPTLSEYYEACSFNNNIYYSMLKAPFRIPRIKDHTMKSWNSTFQLDKDSELLPIKEFSLANVLKINRNRQYPNRFQVALYSPNGAPVIVDFSEYGINPDMMYKIIDAENPDVVIKEGVLNENLKVGFPMDIKTLKRPSFNEKAIKTLSSFGVFLIEFNDQVNATPIQEESKGFLTRLWEWLGF